METEANLNWIEREVRLLTIARRQLFFIGGAPRSGTTWLQFLLDSHPDVSCRGEGLFMTHLAAPLQTMMMARRRALDAKNKTVFGHAEGYPLPEPDDTEHLIGAAILLALERQCSGKTYRAIGEKTPENVFFYLQLKRLFPDAKFICMTRDPRDVLSSAWHFFHRPHPSENEREAKITFIRRAIPSLNAGAKATLALRQRYPSACMVVSYEDLRAAPVIIAADLFAFLGVTDDENVVATCIEKSSFGALSGRSHLLIGSKL